MRTEAGYSSVAKAAKALKISNVHLFAIEGGRGCPSKKVANRMAKLYKVPVESILAEAAVSQADFLMRRLDHLSTP
jgi:DNA-binding XRE family transcriptional regulator